MKAIIPIEFAQELEPLLPNDLEIVRADQAGNFDGDASDAEVYLSSGWLESAVLDRILQSAPAIRWQHTPSAGIEHLLTPTALSRDLILTNGAGVHDTPLAEFVLALMLDRAKHLFHLHQRQTQCQWDERWKDGMFLDELSQATVLILGAGRIGQAIAQRASAFGMRVWGSRKKPTPHPQFETIVGADEWHDLLPTADFVILALPLTPETRNIINADVLRSMQRSAYLINVARGALVDETALSTALTQGWIAGAALDVFVQEPLPPDSPLWAFPNLFVTPHIAWSSARNRQRAIDLFLDNLDRYRTGQSLRNMVDRHAGY
jgi:phosphoglycerate dehydrogenase-like enzyme